MYKDKIIPDQSLPQNNNQEDFMEIRLSGLT